MKNVDNKPNSGEEVAENTLPTQQNKNFVELEGGENRVFRVFCPVSANSRLS